MPGFFDELSKNYGLRPDGTPKGKGWLGPLKMKDGGTMTEYSMGIELGGKEFLIPSIVPTLSKEEIDHLLEGGDITPTIFKKAVDHARPFILKGESPFK